MGTIHGKIFITYIFPHHHSSLLPFAGELLLGGEHLLPARAAHNTYTHRLRCASIATNQLLSMGTICARIGGAHVLRAMHHVAWITSLALWLVTSKFHVGGTSRLIDVQRFL